VKELARRVDADLNFYKYPLIISVGGDLFRDHIIRGHFRRETGERPERL